MSKTVRVMVRGLEEKCHSPDFKPSGQRSYTGEADSPLVSAWLVVVGDSDVGDRLNF